MNHPGYDTDSGQRPVARPFLSWVGGKRSLVPKLLRFLPGEIDDLVYHEPFLGAASLFFAVGPSTAVLSDANGHLISCFGFVRTSPRLVSRYLEQHRRLSSREYYYAIRELYNRSGPSAAQAARFIYLNKACFNGIFRVNQAGQFNVPFGGRGARKALILPSRESLEAASNALQSATLRTASFEDAVSIPSPKDFFYFDPPYPPLNGTSFFTHYTKDRFTHRDQEAVADLVRSVAARGARIMVSNADTPQIRKLYRGFALRPLSAVRYVTCKAKKHVVAELLVTNYEPPSRRSVEEGHRD